MADGTARDRIATLCRERDAVGFGVAKLARIRTDDFLLSAETIRQFPLAISVALPVSSEVLATLTDAPNRLYEHHYRQVNFALDRLGHDLGNLIRKLGGSALPIPASQIVDWQSQRAHLSHKRVAIAAGLGWLGRNNLLVTPHWGSQVRLITVLTNLPLPADDSLTRTCGDCRACVAVCPAAAIHDDAVRFDHLACLRMLKDFQRRRLVSQYICGLCVRACAGVQRS